MKKGRPVSADVKKNRVVVYLSEHEFSLLKKLSDASYHTMSTFARICVLNGLKEEK